jgi:peptidoglycan hydrolase CwlO-like protein
MRRLLAVPLALVATSGCTITDRLDLTISQLGTVNAQLSETNQRLADAQSKLDQTNRQLDSALSKLDEANRRLDVVDQAILTDLRQHKVACSGATTS